MKRSLVVGMIIGLVVGALGFAGYALADDEAPPLCPGCESYTGHRQRSYSSDAGTSTYMEPEILHDYMTKSVADAFDLTVEELQAAHDDGVTLWEIAQERGLTEEEFNQLFDQARSDAIAAALADGVITQEQAGWMNERMENRRADGFGPGSEFCDDSGSGGPRGHRNH